VNWDCGWGFGGRTTKNAKDTKGDLGFAGGRGCSVFYCLLDGGVAMGSEAGAFDCVWEGVRVLVTLRSRAG